MSPVLSLRRPSKRTDPTSDEVQVPGEDLPPVADGAHLVRSALATKAATAGLLTCLVLGPVGALTGALGLLRPTPPAAGPAVSAVDLSHERAVVAQFAQQVVVTWLTSTQDKPEALLALVKDAQTSALSQVPFTVVDPAVAGVMAVEGTWSVTVAATVTDARRSTQRRFFQVPVRYTGGTLSAVTLPSPVAPPPVTAGTSTGYRAPVDLTSPLGATVGAFLSTYLAGSGDVSRYLTPGLTLSPVTPAPYTAVRLLELRAAGSEQPPGTVPKDGTRTRVLALGTGVVTEAQTSPVAYALTLSARAGRWEITAIDPAPAQPPTTPSAGSTPGPARPAGSPSLTLPGAPASATPTP